MGMNFSPMYQPVSTKTIKADGDLDVSPYDVIGYDGHFDTVEADEFVGGVGNFSKVNGVIYVPWTTTTTATDIQLTPAHSATTAGGTVGWRTVLTFNVPQPTTQPSFGINLDTNINTFYSSVTMSGLYTGTQLRYKVRVNGVEYPEHAGTGNSGSSDTFTDNNVLFNIGDNVIEYYQNTSTGSRTPNISTPAVYITPVTE